MISWTIYMIMDYQCPVTNIFSKALIFFINVLVFWPSVNWLSLLVWCCEKPKLLCMMMPYKWCLQEHKEKGGSVGTNVSNSFPSCGCHFMVLKTDPYNQIEKSISFQANYFLSDKLLRFITLLYSLELILVWKIKSIVQGCDIVSLH